MIAMNKRTVVYKNLETSAYFVQPLTMGPVAATEFGEATVIPSDEFDSRIADAVTENLKKFGKERYEKARAILRTKEQQKQFLKAHVGVSVIERESGELAIRALHRERGGMVSSHEDTFVLSKDEIPEKLTAAIAEAFKRAT